MPKLVVSLETVTPMFLCGADNQTPELRPASFRGALRFWLRALLGINLGSDLSNLRKAESAVFGSTNGASPMLVRISARVPIADRLKLAEDRLVVPHSKTFKKSAWAEDGQFDLTLRTREGQNKFPEEAFAALLLLLNLGGIGNRSRRGFGSLQATKTTAEVLPEDPLPTNLLTQSFTDGNDLEQHLVDVLAWARGAVPISAGSPYSVTCIPDYPVLSDEHAKVLVCRHPFTNTHYHEAMINFWDRLRRPQYASQEEAFGFAKGTMRRASPLFLHIGRSTAGYHLIMTAFRSRPEPIGPRGWTLIDNFMNERATAWNGSFLIGGGVRW